jgi:shikimate dehydrogenase
MVYRPRVTPLLAAAAAAGATPIAGLEMFLGQAAAQLALFTAQPEQPPLAVDELRALLPASLVEGG